MTYNVAELEREISQENKPDDPVVRQLQCQFANALVLYMNYKQYHWQTYGPLFRDLHLMWEEFADQALKTLDPLAERIRMIGQKPAAQLRSLQETASVMSTEGDHNMRRMIEEAHANVLHVIKQMREGARTADQENDPGTVELFSRFVQIYEKQEWFLRELLKKGDQLVS
ncbi:MAG TPA: DNA starvation/stationary phase protection protein [Bryobacterales bacterium]|jgi:starvation-inducible DNA-binding protein|nr:DNA starvation/stationary phase protection protein [Bryobacterales bacterium]